MRIAGAALAGGLSVAGAVVLAQDGGPGPRLTFGVSQTVDYDDNLDLDVVSEGGTVQSLTGLSFGLSSENEISSLEFFAGTALRVFSGPDTGNTVETDLDGTRIGLAYDRAVATASLSVDGFYSMDQIDTTLTLADFGPGSEVPEDFGSLTGTGMRRFFSLGAVLGLRQDAPLSYEIFGEASVLGYSDTSASDLTGNNRANVGAAVTARFDELTRGRLAMSYGTFNSDDADVEDSDNLGFDLGVTRDLPNGTIGGSIFVDSYTESEDSRAGFTLSRSLDLAAGSLVASLGATQLQDQDPEVTGAIAWSQELPNGGLNLSANRGVQNNSDNEPQYVTGLRFGYARDLDPLSQLGLDISYAQTENALPPVDSTTAASFSAIYSRSLTPDWALDIGYTYRQSDEDDAGTARSNAVFVGLRRAWELRP